MNQFANETKTLTLEPGINRVVVLMPNHVLSEGRMARQIWNLSQAHQSSLLLIARIESADQEMTARRQLATMSSLLDDVWHRVEIKVVIEKSWSLVLEDIVRPGDLIVCHKEQEVSGRLDHHQPLSFILQKQFHLPVHVLYGFSLKENQLHPHRLIKAALITGSFLLILVSFFVFEVRIDHLVKGITGQILLILILLIEYGLFWLLNNLAN